MTHFDTTIDIQAPRARVWATLSDIGHWSEWTPTVTGMRPLDPGPLAVGTRAISRATLSLDFSGPLGPLCARLTRGLNARYLAIEARGLKKCAEADAQANASTADSAGGSR